MSEEDRKLQKHLVDEMMKVSESNPDVMFYMEALMKYCIEIEQKVEQLEKIRKEAIEHINHAQNYGTMAQVMPHLKPYINGDDLLDILNKGSDKE